MRLLILILKGGEHMNKTTHKKTAPANPASAVKPKTLAKKAKRTMKKSGVKGGASMAGTAAGALVGAAIGGATGAALSDKRTRQKM